MPDSGSSDFENLLERIGDNWRVDTTPGEGNLEKYWKYGAGAKKIRWGTGGDFTRCKRHLTKHVGPERANRICATWHHEMTGIWPGHHGGKNPEGPG